MQSYWETSGETGHGLFYCDKRKHIPYTCIIDYDWVEKILHFNLAIPILIHNLHNNPHLPEAHDK
jgi:hypothetical protein